MKKTLILFSILLMLSACGQSDTNEESETEASSSSTSEEVSENIEIAEDQDVNLDPLEFDIAQPYEGGDLILKMDMENFSPGMLRNLIELNSAGEEVELGSLNLAGSGEVILDESNEKLYFMSYEDPENLKNVSVFEFDFNSKEVRKVPIPISEDLQESELWDFELAKGKVFYLEGLCVESGNCKLMSYDLENEESELVAENLESGPVTGFSIDLYDEQEEKLILSLAGGDAGVINRKGYELDVNNPELVETGDYTYYGNCDEESIAADMENCSEDEIASTLEFRTMRDGVAELLCPNQEVREKYKEDWSAAFVWCTAS